MNITVHVYHHFDQAGDARHAELVGLLNVIIQKENILMSTLDDLVASVAAEDTVIDGTVALIQGLIAQVAALKTTQTDPATGAKIDALVADTQAKTAALAAANLAGTPAPVPGATPITPAAASTAAVAAVKAAGP